ncbi:MAG: neutral/alkaline non-lysosomal ceramidase N-terminal domain-containing protein, partial [Candidatus Lokiarchaeota archaeon]|nr:neutral/alkaline non-lysosomal ceramidase N-terminal domain-containing protein [Candidatus Lokiarchaeota archaeon]
PLGTPLGGYENRKFHALGIHDDLRARCMLFHDTGTGIHAAVIICDLLWVNYGFTDGIKAIIEEITRGVVKADNVVVSAIHTHSSQRLESGLDFYYKPVKKKHDIDKGWYVKHGIPYLQRAVASSVYGALQDLSPATVKCMTGKTDAGHNRRYGDDAAKVVDDEVLALAFLEGEGRLVGRNIRALFYNVANHCVALGEENYLISADWPFFTGRMLARAFHLDWRAPVIFGQGAAGNTNPYNCKFGEEVREIQDAENVGNQVAADVIRTLREEWLKPIATRGEPASVKVLKKTVFVEVTDPPKVAFYKQFDLGFIGVVDRGGKLCIEIRISIVKINDLVLVAIPGEPFGEFGVAIKAAIREANASYVPAVLELSDGAVGYITTRDSYHNKKGYEASLAGSAETGYEIVKAIRSLLPGLA